MDNVESVFFPQATSFQPTDHISSSKGKQATVKLPVYE